MAWLCLSTLVLAHAVAFDRPDGRPLRALAIGGFAQILVASLAYLGPVLRGGGHERLAQGFRTTRSWVSLVAGNAAGVAALVGAEPVLLAALAVWAADLVARSIALVSGALADRVVSR